MPLPYDIVDVEKELNEELKNVFTAEKSEAGFVWAGPNKNMLPANFREIAEDIYNFELRPDDVWIWTFPRSGTTLTQEMIWLICNDLDFDSTRQLSLFERFPQIELSAFGQGVRSTLQELSKGNPEQEEAASKVGVNIVPILGYLPIQRFIKVHLDKTLLPPKLFDTCKVVYVARSPKDVAPSYYHLCRLLSIIGFQGTFEEFWNYFEKEQCPWSPYWAHVRQGWEMRNHPNVLFLFYYDVVKDMRGTIRRVANFLGKKLSDSDVEKLADHLHIDNFRKNPSVNLEMVKVPGVKVDGEQGFIRQGKSGGDKPEYTPELAARANKWIQENMNKIPDFIFPEMKQ